MHVEGSNGVFSDRTMTWGYDNLNRLVSETADEGNNGPDSADHEDTYTYDLQNRLTGVDRNGDGDTADAGDVTGTTRLGTEGGVDRSAEGGSQAAGHRRGSGPAGCGLDSGRAAESESSTDEGTAATPVEQTPE